MNAVPQEVSPLLQATPPDSWRGINPRFGYVVRYAR